MLRTGGRTGQQYVCRLPGRRLDDEFIFFYLYVGSVFDVYCFHFGPLRTLGSHYSPRKNNDRDLTLHALPFMQAIVWSFDVFGRLGVACYPPTVSVILRILMVHNAYAKPSGEEHAVSAITHLLKQRGHEIIAYGRSSADIAPTLAGKSKAFFSGIYNFRTRAEIIRLLDSTRIDLVQIQNLYPQISAAILRPCSERGIPVVMRCPNYRLFCPTGLHLHKSQICERCAGGREWNCIFQNCEHDRMKSLGYAIRNAFSRISGMIEDNVCLFIVLSHFQKSKFIENGIPAERIAVISNYETLSPGPLEDNTDPGETISFVGRPSAEKGIACFVDAARALPEYSFAVAGDPTQIRDLMVKSPPNVRYWGFLSGSELDEFYRRTKIFVYSGIWFEGFPNVVTRAMAAGKPVISSRIGAMPEIVTENETGMLFEPGNVRELTDRIRMLYPDTDRCRALGASGRAKVQREYSADAVYPALMDAYARARKIAGSHRVNKKRTQHLCDSGRKESKAWHF